MSKVLLIDDYKTSRELLADLLGKQGCEVDTAADGESGLSLAKETVFDLILIDLILPRTSAYSLVQQLLGLPSPYSCEKIAILYTIGSDELLEPIRELGITNFILKSTTNQEAIVSQITTLCHASHSDS